MNQAQKDKILATIAKDCTLRGEYFKTLDPDSMDACVIGGLGLACGTDKKEFLSSFEGLSPARLSERIHCLKSVVKRLYEEYGLDVSQLTQMQRLNDQTENLDERRECLTGYVNSLTVEPI